MKESHIEKIRKTIQEGLRHRNPWEKHVSIFSEVGTGYDVLIWEYDGHEVRARSRDYTLLEAIKLCIELYLEEEDKI